MVDFQFKNPSSIIIMFPKTSRKTSKSIKPIQHPSSLIILHHGDHPESTSKEPVKLAVFDLDGTLIVPKTKNMYPKNPNDWKLRFDEIKPKLEKLVSSGFRIVVISNQLGIGMGYNSPSKFVSKANGVLAALDVPLTLLASTQFDEYRKPFPALWDYFTQKLLRKRKIDHKNSFFCGDSAGRGNDIQKRVMADHSNCDLLFAANVNLPFKTPEMFFKNKSRDFKLVGEINKLSKICLEKKDFLEMVFGQKQRVLLAVGESEELEKRKGENRCLNKGKGRQSRQGPRTLILVSGSPSSGKSHLIDTFFGGLPIFSWQDFRSRADLLEKVRKDGLSKKSRFCVIKDICPTVEKRRAYVRFGRSNNFETVFINVNIEKDVCLFFNALRLVKKKVEVLQ